MISKNTHKKRVQRDSFRSRRAPSQTDPSASRRLKPAQRCIPPSFGSSRLTALFLGMTIACAAGVLHTIQARKAPKPLLRQPLFEKGVMTTKN